MVEILVEKLKQYNLLNNKIISILEGGYNIEAEGFAPSVVEHIKGLFNYR